MLLNPSCVMMRKSLMVCIRILAFLICFTPVTLFAQVIDETSSYRNMESDRYFRLHYVNDFFAATDFYYSQGINFELGYPVLKKNPLNFLLPKLKNSEFAYGIAVEHAVFTPLSIRNPDISFNDHPFAAYFILKSFLISTDTIHQQRLSSTISTGVLGPAVFGHGMQKSIHESLKNIEPLGWEHQISNDFIFNYELFYERRLYQPNTIFLINGIVKLQAGTLLNNIQAGFTVIAGKYNSPFSSFINKPKHRYKIYFYAQPFVALVGYNATLEGGMFNRESEYKLSAAQLERALFQTNFGVVIGDKKTYLEFFHSFLSKEFEKGKLHRWGGIVIGFRF